MASSSFSLHWVVSFVLVFSFIRPRAEGSPLVAQVCRLAKNSTFCEVTLRSDPRSTKANLATLVLVSIEFALSNATNTRELIGKLLQNQNENQDSAFKSSLQECALRYDGVISHLAPARCSLCSGSKPSGNYYSAIVAGSVSMVNSDDCEKYFKDEPPFLSPLTENNHHLKLLGDTVMVISKLSQERIKYGYYGLDFTELVPAILYNLVHDMMFGLLLALSWAVPLYVALFFLG